MKSNAIMRKSFLLFNYLLIAVAVNFSWANEPLIVRFLDVGYADAVLLQLPGGKNAMIDAGGPETATKVVEVLKRLGISRLDFVVVTHSDENHLGGFKEILKHFEIHQVYVNDENKEGREGYFTFLSEMQKRVIPVTVLRRGQEIDLESEDARILVLHPGILSGSANEDSLSLLLDYGKTRFWFTADIQPEGQDDIIREFPEVLSADCVQVPHHGGKLSESFISMAREKIFVMSTGKNEYEKPFTEYLNLLSGRLLRTDRNGDIIIISDGFSIRVLNE